MNDKNYLTRTVQMIYIGITVVFWLIIFLVMYNYQLRKQLETLQMMMQVVENSKDIFYYCDMKPNMQYRYLSPVINQILGENKWSQYMQDATKYYDIVHPDDLDRVIQKDTGQWDYNETLLIRLQNDQGRYIWFEEHATPVYKDGELVAMQGVYHNVENKMIAQQELEYKVVHDYLTGAKNRAYFDSQMAHYNNKENTAIGIIICDLDYLKRMNDTHGHKIGDAYIKQSASLIQEAVDAKGIVSRIGGDEFAIILPHTTNEQLKVVMNHIQYKLEQFNNITERFSIEMSIGGAFSSHSLGQMEKLFDEADQKMYKEKQRKKN